MQENFKKFQACPALPVVPPDVRQGTPVRRQIPPPNAVVAVVPEPRANARSRQTTRKKKRRHAPDVV